MKLRWVTTDDGFAALEPAWSGLFARGGSHGVFLSWEWVSNWWRRFGSGRALRILVAGDDDGSPRLIAPFQVVSRRVLGGQVARDWLLLGADSIACSDHLGFLRAPDTDADEAEAVMEAVWERVGPRGRLRLTDLSGDDPWWEAVSAWAGRRGLAVGTGPGPVCPALKLADSWDGFLADLSRNFRAQVRSSVRKVDAAFETVRVSGADAVREAAREIVRLNRLRMDEKGVASSFRDPRMAAFLEDVAVDLEGAGRAWVDMIRAPEGTVAVALHLVHGRTVSYYQGGFDPAYAAYRPATVLFARVIERAIEGGFTQLDFLRGDEAYKYRWGAVPVASRVLAVAPPGPGPRLRHLAADGWERVARAVAVRRGGRRAAAAAVAREGGRDAAS